MKNAIFLKFTEKKGKNEAIKEILASLEIEDADTAFCDIMKREALSSTLVAPFIAIPHARSKAVDSLCWAISKFDEPVVWDGGEAKIVVLTLSPINASGEHVIFLSHVAQILDDQEKLERLLNADNIEEMEDIFSL